MDRGPQGLLAARQDASVQCRLSVELVLGWPSVWWLSPAHHQSPVRCCDQPERRVQLSGSERCQWSDRSQHVRIGYTVEPDSRKVAHEARRTALGAAPTWKWAVRISADALAANMMATRELGLTARCEARPELRQAARSARIIFHIRRVHKRWSVEWEGGRPFSVECGTTVRAGVPASFSPNLVDRTVDSLRD